MYCEYCGATLEKNDWWFSPLRGYHHGADYLHCPTCAKETQVTEIRHGVASPSQARGVQMDGQALANVGSL